MRSPFLEPIPLSSIERLHYFDSSSNFPNRITSRIRVSQTLNLRQAQQACFWLGERHPILGCSIKKIAGRLMWIRDPNWFRLDAQPSGTRSIPHSEPDCPWFKVENHKSPPDFLPHFATLLGAAESYRPCMLIRQWPQPPSHQAVELGSETSLLSEVWFSVHHSFCDGAGGIQIMSDWIQIYENLVCDRPPLDGLPPLDPQRFHQRNCLGLSKWKFLKHLPFQAIGLFGAAKFVFRSTPSLDPVAQQQIPVSQRSTTACLSTWLDGQLPETQATLQSQGFNSNAKYLGDLFAALEDWLQKPTELQQGNPPWVRIIVPINVRDIADRRLPAANRSSLIQIDRRKTAEKTPQELYRMLHRELGIVFRFQLDKMFLIMVRLLSVTDPLLKRAAQNPKSRGLAVFTNLGRPFRKLERRLNAAAGQIEQPRSDFSLNVQEIDFLAPLRRGTPLNFALAQFQGRLRITLHFDRQFLTPDQAQDLLESYVLAIRQRSA